MMGAYSLAAFRDGARAVVDGRLRGAPMATNPFRNDTRRHRAWENGAREAEKLVSQLERLTR